MATAAAPAFDPDLRTDQARAIAHEAFIYGFPLVEGYKTLYKQALDASGANFKAPFNQIGHSRSVATPADTWVVTPNSDTPYSYCWADLRAEPVLLTLPAIEAGRYYSVQLVDLQTFNFAYLGTRSTGNGGGDFLVAGPGWDGDVPAGVTGVVRCETALVYALFRTQLFSPDDIGAVHRIQDGYRVRTLSDYLGRAAPPPAPGITGPPPAPGMTESPALFRYLNFLLQFCPTHPSERELMARFRRLGIGAGLQFDPDGLPPALAQAVAQGVDDALGKDLPGVVGELNAGRVSSGDVFGTREFLAGNYLYRFVGAKLGIYGNSREEALYPTYFVDASGDALDASRHDYTLRFESGRLPPARAFWSLTMYDGKTQLLVANPLGRYLLNSTMLDRFVREPDGAVVLDIARAPVPGREANWLPAPSGPFYCILRLYIPEPEVFTGQWQPPKLQVRP
jgi:hypothetical protein